MSQFANPKIAEIDDALAELDPSLEEFGCSHGFALTQSHEGSFNVPRRWLNRESAGIRHEIGLTVASTMPDRLERGFYPDIPLTLYVAAFDRAAQRYYHTTVLEAEPFRSVRESLIGHLTEALVRLNTCTPEFIARHGFKDPLGSNEGDDE